MKTEFTKDELALIRAGCLTACPQYPVKPMWEPWASVFEKAGKMIHVMNAQELGLCWKCGEPEHFDYCPYDM